MKHLAAAAVLVCGCSIKQGPAPRTPSATPCHHTYLAAAADVALATTSIAGMQDLDDGDHGIFGNLAAGTYVGLLVMSFGAFVSAAYGVAETRVCNSHRTVAGPTVTTPPQPQPPPR